MNTDALTALINETTTTILNEWTAEAVALGSNVETYIEDQMDILEETDPEVCMAVSKARLMALVS